MVAGVPSTAPHIVDTYGFWLGLSMALTLGSFLPAVTASSKQLRRRYLSAAIAVAIWLLAEVGVFAAFISTRFMIYVLDPTFIASALFLQLALVCVGVGQGLESALGPTIGQRKARGVSTVVASGVLGAVLVICLASFLRDPNMYRYEAGSFIRFMLPGLGLAALAAVSTPFAANAGGTRDSGVARYLTPFWSLACVALSLSFYAQLMPLGLFDWRGDFLPTAFGVPLILALGVTLIAEVGISVLNIRDIAAGLRRRRVPG